MVQIIDVSTLPFNMITDNKDKLYSVVIINGSPVLKPLSINNAKYALATLWVDIDETNSSKEVDVLKGFNQSQVSIKESQPPVDKKRDKPIKTWVRQTYKIDSSNEQKTIFVTGRREGHIRVSFTNKDSAQNYYERIRELFYAKVSGADALTVGSIYDLLGIVNYDKDECAKWGYLCLDGGTCRYISEVNKTVGEGEYWGFTLKHPIKLYGETKEKAL